MGGQPTTAAIETAEHTLADWEVLADAVAVALAQKGLRSTDELRRAIEDLSESDYLASSYYERWIRATEALLVEKGVLTRAEIDQKLAQLEDTWEIS